MGLPDRHYSDDRLYGDVNIPYIFSQDLAGRVCQTLDLMIHKFKEKYKMEIDFKKEARKQYLHFFRFWFIIVGILLVVTVFAVIGKSMMRTERERHNSQSPTERVFDYAEVLTDQQENELRELIAEKEAQIGCDLVLVTMRQPVEGSEAKETYNYRYTSWELNMQDIADDFYDNNAYGYNAPHGDGALILDNWYEDQEGTHLSTSGRVFERFGNYDIDAALSWVDRYIESDPQKAYSACINYIADRMSGHSGDIGTSILMLAAIVPLIVAGVFVGTHLRSKQGKKTTTATTYIVGGKPVMNQQRDDFVRKHVSQRRIQTSSSSGGGRGGAHVSSGGHTHGGGSHRR